MSRSSVLTRSPPGFVQSTRTWVKITETFSHTFSQYLYEKKWNFKKRHERTQFSNKFSMIRIEVLMNAVAVQLHTRLIDVHAASGDMKNMRVYQCCQRHCTFNKNRLPQAFCWVERFKRQPVDRLCDAMRCDAWQTALNHRENRNLRWQAGIKNLTSQANFFFLIISYFFSAINFRIIRLTNRFNWLMNDLNIISTKIQSRVNQMRIWILLTLNKF